MEEKTTDQMPKVFEPTVFEPTVFGEPIPESIPKGFDTYLLQVNGTQDSSLDFSDVKKKAKDLVSQGIKILWDIDLGLFDRLKFPIENEAQEKALALSLIHFQETLYKEFIDESVGVSLYKGTADFARIFPWSSFQEELFDEWKETLGQTDLLPQYYASKVCINAIVQLAKTLSDTLEPFVLLDASSVDPSLCYQALSKEHFVHIQVAMKAKPYIVRDFDWQESWGLDGFIGDNIADNMDKKNSYSPRIAVVFPKSDIIEKERLNSLQGICSTLLKKNIPFLAIAESRLTADWDGLDTLVVDKNHLSSQGKRKLMGFLAAGGLHISLNGSLGLKSEVPIEQLF